MCIHTVRYGPKENHETHFVQLSIAADAFVVCILLLVFFFTWAVFFHFVIWISLVRSRNKRPNASFFETFLSVKEIEKQAQKQMLRNVFCGVVVRLFFVSVCCLVSNSLIVKLRILLFYYRSF